jgi:hypothetical protein
MAVILAVTDSNATSKLAHPPSIKGNAATGPEPVDWGQKCFNGSQVRVRASSVRRGLSGLYATMITSDYWYVRPPSIRISWPVM